MKRSLSAKILLALIVVSIGTAANLAPRFGSVAGGVYQYVVVDNYGWPRKCFARLVEAEWQGLNASPAYAFSSSPQVKVKFWAPSHSLAGATEFYLFPFFFDLFWWTLLWILLIRSRVSFHRFQFVLPDPLIVTALIALAVSGR
ncbi:hypothetical protein [Lignipirellula cremea]|uniref:hypothetical protein n=1 Tax=Lignipirellula cremea TaxID=2528010 RepID=UPI0011AB17C7|nr:hypothetical protein [Lignipirellula cremea]